MRIYIDFNYAAFYQITQVRCRFAGTVFVQLSERLLGIGTGPAAALALRTPSLSSSTTAFIQRGTRTSWAQIYR